ncbi:unnamed protein product [Lupinus luteus]|uniref:26S proteasome regulatory subunit RPN10 n=1 Tax=Lupinus luteus TaxID=3873 RepID=A0AAV1WQZ2_LUPLU
MEENGKIRSLDATPTWAVATVITIMVSLSFMFQITLEKFGKWLDRTKRKSMLSALEKVKEELMLFGLLSLLMGHWTIFVAKICVKASVLKTRFIPCAIEKNSGTVEHIFWPSSEYSNRTILQENVNNGLHNYCPKGKESFASYESLEQLHSLLFILGVTHVFYSFIAVGLAMIKNHELPLNYDFHNYMLRSMDEEFRDIVGISVPLWIYAICCIILNFHGSNIYFWLSFLPAILILIIGTKLHRVVVKLAVEITDYCQDTRPLNLRDELFWFGKPKLLLWLIHLISFLNAFEMATFLWSLWEIKEASCFMKNRTFIVIRLSFGVISQVWGSFITFPLYVIITQMGSKMKKSVVSENVRKSLSKWQGRVKNRQGSSCAQLDAASKTTSDSLLHDSESFPSSDDYHATMICIDNSEWMRNGDYSPSRFQAQADAVNLICGAKTQSNPENTVGILTMAGKGVRVLVTPTSDLGKILACMHGGVDELSVKCFCIEHICSTFFCHIVLHVDSSVLKLIHLLHFVPKLGLEIGGEMNLAAGIQVAQLALKHRQNKKQQQRIIVFAGGPVKHEKKMLEMIGRKLKKNSVALDIINFGEEDEGKTEKLEGLLSAVNNNDASHIVHVPAGPDALSDVLISTPIFTGDGEGGTGFAAAAAAAAAGGVSGYEFGVDPNLDPELALALRVSMEEERARQEAAAKKAAEDASKQEKGGEHQVSSQDATMTERASAATSEAENKTSDLMDDENALLEQALAMSMDDPVINHDVKDTDMSEAASDDPELALDSTKDAASQSDMSKLLADESFVSSILASLPGVDPNDPSVKDLLASMQSQSESQQKDEDKPSSNEEEKK